MVIEVLRKLCAYQAAAEQEQASREQHVIGSIVRKQMGPTMTEEWIEGETSRKFKAEKDRLAQEEKLLSDERILLSKQKRALTLQAKKADDDDKKETTDTSSDSKTDKKASNDNFQKPAPVLIPAISTDELYEKDIINVASTKAVKKEALELEEKMREFKHEKKRAQSFQRLMYNRTQARFTSADVLKPLPEDCPKGRYLILELLGKGGFSEVYKAFDIKCMQYVACKVHHVSPHWHRSKADNYFKHVTREYEIHKKLRHKRIVPLLDVFLIDDNTFCTVMEYCNGPDLDMYLKEKVTLPEKEAHVIMAQVCHGLKYLKEQNPVVIHYDLKPANILFHDRQVKITDFGLSKVMEESAASIELTSQGSGTYWYLPPECFGENPMITSAVDVWSAGVILFQLLYGKRPYGDQQSQQVIQREGIIANAKPVVFPEKPIVSKATKE